MAKTVDKKNSLRCIKYLEEDFRALSYGGGINGEFVCSVAV
jgi:hypothetical protein